MAARIESELKTVLKYVEQINDIIRKLLNCSATFEIRLFPMTKFQFIK